MKTIYRLISYLLLLVCLASPAIAQNILGTSENDAISTELGSNILISYGHTITANDVTLSYVLIDCEDAVGQIGLTISGTGFTGYNLTVVRCPGGGLVFNQDATLINSIVYSDGDDITISAGKTVTGDYNIFGDAGSAGAGTYTDGGNTLFSTDPLFRSTSSFRLRKNSPAINAGTDVSLTTDYAGFSIVGTPDIGAYEFCIGNNIDFFGGGAGGFTLLNVQ